MHKPKVHVLSSDTGKLTISPHALPWVKLYAVNTRCPTKAQTSSIASPVKRAKAVCGADQKYSLTEILYILTSLTSDKPNRLMQRALTIQEMTTAELRM